MACSKRQAFTITLLFLPSRFQQTATLVNLKLKWAKDRPLDLAVSREKHLLPALNLTHLLFSHSSSSISPFDPLLRRLHLPNPLAFLRLYPSFFHESPSTSSFSLTPVALRLHRDHLETLRFSEPDLVDRLRKLLMLTTTRSLPLHTIDQLHFDMGLPFDYQASIIPRHPDIFRTHHVPGDERVWLGLVRSDDELPVSEFQRENPGGCEFPIRFTRGFGMKKKWMQWLAEFQKLPYISPYEDASRLDPRTDVSEKRIVGVFHELLCLTIGKKTDRRNVSNLRKALGLPQKFTKVFERHPGIFYLSQKLGTQTVVLREAYGGERRLVKKHPLMEVRERYIALLRTGRVDGGNSDQNGSDEECETTNYEYFSPDEESDDDVRASTQRTEL